MVKVLFVCLGNICRSPTAHGVFRHLVKQQGLSKQISLDSAGTAGYHTGVEPDSRSQATAMQHGIDISDLQARKVVLDDFAEYDYIVAMDRENLDNLLQIQPHHSRAALSLLLAHSEHWPDQEVPDPYYGGAEGFEDVFAKVEDGCNGLLKRIVSEKKLTQ